MAVTKRSKRTVWTYYQVTSPVNPRSGETWYDTANHLGYLWDESSWVDFTVGNYTPTNPITYGSPLMISGFGDFSLSFNQTEGSLWGWGLNGHGRLGDNTTANKSSPVSVVGGHTFIKACACGNHALFLEDDGSVWSCGNNVYGALGINSSANNSSPVSVLGGDSFTYIAGGYYHSLAIRGDGTLWSWGFNSSYGQLGDGTTTNRSSPTSVIGNHSFIQIAGGQYQSYALKSDGSAWAWEENTSGYLGDNTTTSRSSPTSVVGGHSFIQIAYCGARKEDGSVWTWGQYNGDNTPYTNRSSPTSVVGNHSFIQITKSTQTTAALKEDGSVWTFGYNYQGECGDGTTTARFSPVSVLGGHSFVSISSGLYNVFALKADGSIWSWGDNQYGQLGDGTTIDRSSPVSVVRNFG